MVLACTILLAAERPIGALAREALPLQEGQRLGGPAADKRPATDTIAVDVAAGLRPVERRIVGINTNYLTDHAGVRSRGQGYEQSLRELGVKSLRYPEGEMADELAWAAPPYTSPQPTLLRTGPQEWPSNDPRWVADGTTFINAPLNFDEFMTYARRVGAEPTLVVAFDSMYKPATPGGTAPTKQQLLDAAVAWVRYANVTRGYGVKYWEIGNESYLNSYNGGAKASDYARDLVDFARAMKAVDPTIMIGANGPDSQYARGELDSGGAWWQTVLTVAAPVIDFLAVHSYPAWQWGSYGYYQKHTPVFTGAADAAAAAVATWAPQHAQRIRIAVTEMNSADWSKGGWSSENNNSLGHAVVLFEMIGAHLLHPQVDMAQVWNTRWINATTPDLWNTLDAQNAPLATGRAVAIWGQFLQTQMVQTTNTAMVRAFASYNPANGHLSVFLINKDTSARRATVSLQRYTPVVAGEQWRLSGNGADDMAPRWGKVGGVAASGNQLAVSLDPVSVTVLDLVPAATSGGPDLTGTYPATGEAAIAARRASGGGRRRANPQVG
jgi:alpha-L-arabinofuranosidase